MLIRSSKLTKEPLVLTLPRTREAGVVAPMPEPPVAEAVSFVVPFMPEDGAVPLSDTVPEADLLRQHTLGAAGAGVAVTALSYAEYKERFKQELETMREAALQDGYREGETLARQQVEEEYAEKIRTLSALVVSAREAVDNGIDALHDVGAEIVFEATLKILGTALATPEGVRAVVREIIRRAKDTTRLVIRLAPADVEMIGDSQTLLGGIGDTDVEIVADERVALGGCLLETPAGNLDGRLEVQLQGFREVLLSARAKRIEGGGS